MAVITTTVDQSSDFRHATHIRPYFDTLRYEQNGWHFLKQTKSYIFLDENIWIWNEISLKLKLYWLIESKSAMDWVMAWLLIGKKLLPELTGRLRPFDYAKFHKATQLKCLSKLCYDDQCSDLKYRKI